MADMRDKARALGLDRLADTHLAQLARAIETIERYLRRVPRDLPPSQEMALTFRARPPQ